MTVAREVEPLRVESIAQIHHMLGLPPPAHPHLAVIAASWQEPARVTVPLAGRPIVSDLYVISLKRGDECRLERGRQVFDGQAGSVAFLAPGQTLRPLDASNAQPDGQGWTLAFHPQLLAGHPLATAIQQYRFFAYATEEALHLLEPEREALTSVVRQVEREVAAVPDAFSQEVITAQLLLLLTYLQRAYARQFQLRATAAASVARRLADHLGGVLAGSPREPPSVQSCAHALGYSPDYLSDLLRAETGTGTREHIQDALMQAAKARLLLAGASSSQVAYTLGFRHPQHFARLFRQKTGQSPSAWRRTQLGWPRPSKRAGH